MGTKRAKETAPSVPTPPEITASDRDALIAAYKTGLIASWKRDAERGYRVSITGRADDYVEVPNLIKYLAKLKGAA